MRRKTISILVFLAASCFCSDQRSSSVRTNMIFPNPSETKPFDFSVPQTQPSQFQFIDLQIQILELQIKIEKLETDVLILKFKNKILSEILETLLTPNPYPFNNEKKSQI